MQPGSGLSTQEKQVRLIHLVDYIHTVHLSAAFWRQEEEEEEFYKLLPANKADHLCRTQNHISMVCCNSY